MFFCKMNSLSFDPPIQASLLRLRILVGMEIAFFLSFLLFNIPQQGRWEDYRVTLPSHRPRPYPQDLFRVVCPRYGHSLASTPSMGERRPYCHQKGSPASCPPFLFRECGSRWPRRVFFFFFFSFFWVFYV